MFCGCPGWLLPPPAGLALWRSWQHVRFLIRWLRVQSPAWASFPLQYMNTWTGWVSLPKEEPLPGRIFAIHATLNWHCGSARKSAAPGSPERVSHQSTNRARRCSTSVIGREPTFQRREAGDERFYVISPDSHPRGPPPKIQIFRVVCRPVSKYPCREFKDIVEILT